MAAKLAEDNLFCEFLPTKSHHPLTSWSCEITGQTKTITSPLPKCLQLPNVQDGDIPSQVPNYKVIQSFSHMVLQGPLTNKNNYVSIIRVPMATKLNRMMISLDRLLPVLSHGPLITWPCDIQVSLTGGGSVRKCLSRHQLHVNSERALNWLSSF